MHLGGDDLPSGAACISLLAAESLGEQSVFPSSYMLWIWVLVSDQELTGMLHQFVCSFFFS